MRAAKAGRLQIVRRVLSRRIEIMKRQMRSSSSPPRLLRETLGHRRRSDGGRQRRSFLNLAAREPMISWALTTPVMAEIMRLGAATLVCAASLRELGQHVEREKKTSRLTACCARLRKLRCCHCRSSSPGNAAALRGAGYDTGR